jgi:hypothetical protein
MLMDASRYLSSSIRIRAQSIKNHVLHALAQVLGQQRTLLTMSYCRAAAAYTAIPCSVDEVGAQGFY